MGKVFESETIRDGKTPENGAQYEAGAYIMRIVLDDEDQSFESSQRFNAQAGIMIYGSTALGTANRRSDVDVLVNYHRGDTDVLHRWRTLFTEAERKFNVPVESNMNIVGAFFNPLQHTIDPGFAAHLYLVQEDPVWSYGFPATGLLSGIAPEAQDEHLRAAAVKFAAGKRKYFARSLVKYRGEIDFDYYQRALELPSAIGRKVLSLEVGVDDSIAGEVSRDKTGTIEKTRQRLSDLHTAWSEPWAKNPADIFVELNKLDQEYDQLLEAVIQGNTTLEEYNSWLEYHYLPVLQMAHDISDFWSESIEHKLDIRDPIEERKERENIAAITPDYIY